MNKKKKGRGKKKKMRKKNMKTYRPAAETPASSPRRLNTSVGRTGPTAKRASKTGPK